MSKPQLAQIVLEEINRQEDIRKTATIIQEELLVFKLNQDILKEHQKLIKERKDFWSVVLQEYLKAEHGDKFDSSLIEEGIWTNIKYNIGKLGSLEKGGKIFGKRKERVAAALEKVQAAIDGATQKGFEDFKKNIEAKHKEFPNMREKVDFMAALYEIGGVYDSAEAAVASGDFPGGPAAANYLVKALREYVKWLLDFQLADAYKHFTEEKEIPQDVLAEQLQEWRTKNLKEAPIMPGNVAAATDTRQPQLQKGRTAAYAAPEGPTGASYTKAGREGDEVDSATIKGLKSNKAPAVLAALGALGTGFGWLVQQPWFIAMFQDPGQWVTLKNVILDPLKQSGVTEQLAVLQGNAGANISGMSVGDFVKNMASPAPGSPGLVDAAGNPTKALLDMAAAGGNTNFAKWWADNIIAKGIGVDPTATLGEVIPLSGAGAPGAGGDIFTQKIAKTVVKRVFRQGATSLGAYQLAAAGPWIAALGIGLVSAGAAVKLLRMKGMKSSRAQMLADLYKELVDFPVPEESKIQQAIDPEPDQDDAEQTSDEIEPTPDIEKEEEDDTIQLSGTEMKLMQSIAKVKGTNLNKVINKTVRNLGAALKQPKIKDIVQKFNKTFYPKFNKMIERANIAVAEGIELEEELTGRQQAHKKGKLRSGKAAMRYFKSVGGKPPLLVTQIEDALRDALISKVSADTLFNAVADLKNKTKDPEEIKFLQKDTLKMLEKNPRQRLQIYKKNVDVFIEEVAKLATESIADALGGEAGTGTEDDLSLTKDVSKWDKGEEPVDATVSVDPEKGEEEYEYYFPPKLGSAGSSQDKKHAEIMSQLWMKKYREKYGNSAKQQYSKDLAQLAAFLGPYKEFEAIAESNKLSKTMNKFAQSAAGQGFDQNRVMGGLKKLPPTHGAKRILMALAGHGKSAVITRVANYLASQVKRKAKEVAQPEEKQQQAANDTMGYRPSDEERKVAAEGILEESILNRWKTLSGISKGDG